jgi:hypothetical protein
MSNAAQPGDDGIMVEATTTAVPPFTKNDLRPSVEEYEKASIDSNMPSRGQQ